MQGKNQRGMIHQLHKRATQSEDVESRITAEVSSACYNCLCAYSSQHAVYRLFRLVGSFSGSWPNAASPDVYDVHFISASCIHESVGRVVRTDFLKSAGTYQQLDAGFAHRSMACRVPSSHLCMPQQTAEPSSGEALIRIHRYNYVYTCTHTCTSAYAYAYAQLTAGSYLGKGGRERRRKEGGTEREEVLAACVAYRE